MAVSWRNINMQSSDKDHCVSFLYPSSLGEVRVGELVGGDYFLLKWEIKYKLLNNPNAILRQEKSPRVAFNF